MKLLNYLKADEKKAPKNYSKLLKQVKTKGDKQTIRGIIKDEKSHLRKLKQLNYGR